MKTKLAIVAVGVPALGAAGAGTAYATTHSPSVRPVQTQPALAPASAEAPGTEVADAPGSPAVQHGDQSTPDTATSAETGTEQAGSEKAGSERSVTLMARAGTPTRSAATPTPSRRASTKPNR